MTATDATLNNPSSDVPSSNSNSLASRPRKTLGLTYLCLLAALGIGIAFVTLDWAFGDEPIAYGLVGIVLPILCLIGVLAGLYAANKGALSVSLSMALVALLAGLVIGLNYLWFFIPIIREAITLFA